MMLSVLVSLWLFAFGVLVLAGYRRMGRRLDVQNAALVERARRSDEALLALATSVDQLQGSIHLQQKEARALREQLGEFIEGPPSMRRPPLAPGAGARSA